MALLMYMGVEPKIGFFFYGHPKSHPFVHRVWFSIIFTIHFGGSGPLKHPNRTVDGSLKSGVHQLRLVGSLSTIIFGVSAPSQVVVWDFSHQQ